MIKATKIVIDRAEGPGHLCRTGTFEGPGCWDKARAWLYGQSTTYPEKGGYDKHDLVVHFEDGETYEARLDCKHLNCEDNDLDPAEHIRSFVTYMAGLRPPAHLSQAEYEKRVDMLHKRGGTTRQDYVDFLRTYQLGG